MPLPFYNDTLILAEKFELASKKKRSEIQTPVTLDKILIIGGLAAADEKGINITEMGFAKH